MKKTLGIILMSGLFASVGAYGQTLEFVIGTATAASAASMSAGTYNYGGGGVGIGDLVGSGIYISEVIVSGAPTANGTYDITDGQLSLTSAALSAVVSVSGVDVYTFAGGGSLNLKGCIAAVNGTAGSCTSADDLESLVSDDFTSISISNVGGVQVQSGNLVGNYLPSLASYFGVNIPFTIGADSDTVSGVPVSGTASTSFTASNTLGGAVTTTAAVPEGWNLASTWGLFGFGMVVFVVARRFSLIRPLAF